MWLRWALGLFAPLPKTIAQPGDSPLSSCSKVRKPWGSRFEGARRLEAVKAEEGRGTSPSHRLGAWRARVRRVKSQVVDQALTQEGAFPTQQS